VRARGREESGSALIAAIVLIGVMMSIGLATASYVDGQQAQSGGERVRESAFNVAESALGAQVFQLSRAPWPSTAATALPASCTPSASASATCPDAASLAESYKTPDYTSTALCPGGATSAPAWATTVHDDSGAVTYYSATTPTGAPQPTWDSNANGRMWIKSTGTARCKQRTIVTAVEQGTRDLTFPHNAITANSVTVGPAGRKVIINTQGTKSGQTAPVVVRCCFSAQPGQIAPSPPTVDTAGSPTASPVGDLAAFKAYAQQQSPSTYYPAGTCPPTLSGTAVYVEDLSLCSYPQDANSASAPGHLYIAKGTLLLTGNSRFYGLVYMGNGQGFSGDVVTLQGNARIVGAVAIDGLGGMKVGASKQNFVYDGSVFDGFKGVATVTPAPNTWRELAPGS